MRGKVAKQIRKVLLEKRVPATQQKIINDGGTVVNTGFKGWQKEFKRLHNTLPHNKKNVKAMMEV